MTDVSARQPEGLASSSRSSRLRGRKAGRLSHSARVRKALRSDSECAICTAWGGGVRRGSAGSGEPPAPPVSYSPRAAHALHEGEALRRAHQRRAPSFSCCSEHLLCRRHNPYLSLREPAELLGRAGRQRVTPEEGRTLLDLDRQTHGSKVEAPQKLPKSSRSERKAISRPRFPAEPARAPPLSRRTTQATRAARWL